MSTLDRRRFVRNAAIAGTVAWVTPTIVALTPASAAELNSSPPAPRRAPVSPTPDVSPAAATAGVLAYTGDNEFRNAAIGAASVVAGAGLVALGRERTET